MKRWLQVHIEKQVMVEIGQLGDTIIGRLVAADELGLVVEVDKEGLVAIPLASVSTMRRACND